MGVLDEVRFNPIFISRWGVGGDIGPIYNIDIRLGQPNPKTQR